MLGAKANEDLVTAIANGTEQVRIYTSFKEAKRNVNERSKRNFAKKSLSAINSVSSSRLAEAHLDNCTARKDSGKTSFG